MSWGKVDIKQLEALQAKLAARAEGRQAFIEACAKELAARLLRKVVKRTPVGIYPPGRGMVGGTLRRGWTPAQQVTVRQEGADYIIDIVNPVEYASYVEYGHRTANHKGWVEGRFMLTLSVQEVQDMAPKLLEKRVAEWLGGAL